MKNYLRLLSYIGRYKWVLILHLFFTVLAVFFAAITFPVLQPVFDILFTEDAVPKEKVILPEFTFSIAYFLNLLNYLLVNIIEAEGRWQALMYITIIVVGINILGNIFSYISAFFMNIIRTKVIEDLRRDLFNGTLNLQVAYFEGEKKGDIMTRITSDVNEIEASIIRSFESIFRDPITIAFFLMFMLMYSVHLTLFIFLILPFSAFLIMYIAKSLKKDAYNAQGMYGQMMSTIDETVSGIRIIKAFNAESFIRSTFDKFNRKYSSLSRKQFHKKQLAPPVSQISGVLTVGIILLYGGRLVFDGGIEASEFMVFILIFVQILKPAKSFSGAYTYVFKGMASAERIFSLMDAPRTIRDTADAKVLTGFEKEISFENLNFAYKNDPVLKDISFNIPKGKVYALVGASGSGKSTLAELILRFYDPQSGRILIDGMDLKKVQVKSLRRLIGVVTQDPILFNDSIYNNIAFGMEEVSEEAIINAAKAANAHDFIMETEDGYHSNIGDRGGLLSGGQRQRLSIARALLKNPPILILDEATSALDTSSERIVQDALSKLMKNRTSLVIAHRLSTIQDADNILVMDRGAIVQQGSHQNLIREEGIYKSLYNMQKLGQEGDTDRLG